MRCLFISSSTECFYYTQFFIFIFLFQVKTIHFSEFQFSLNNLIKRASVRPLQKEFQTANAIETFMGTRAITIQTKAKAAKKKKQVRSFNPYFPKSYNLEFIRLNARKILLISAAFVFAVFFSICAYTLYSYSYYSAILDARLANGFLQTRSGLYAAPRTLRAGQKMPVEKLVSLLKRAGYVENGKSDLWNGSFIVKENSVTLYPSSSSNASVTELKIDIKDNRINALFGDKASLSEFQLEPEILADESGAKGGVRRTLDYKEIPQNLRNAIIAIEDRRFNEHSGFDSKGIARAFMANISGGELKQGGSTITQQLVKNTLLSPEKTFRRKFAELLMSVALERRLSKEEIIALYCNEIYLGQRGAVSINGVEQAARVYFNKKLSDLSLNESAAIAAMIKSPRRFSPESTKAEVKERRNLVIENMRQNGFVSDDEAKAAMNEEIAVAPFKHENDSVAPYFVDAVNRQYASRLNNESDLEDEGGIRIYSSIDTELQQIAQTAADNQLKKLDARFSKKGLTPQVSLVAIDPKTGKVLAMIGGRDYATSQLNRATDSKRQPGSTFKPIVYAAALQSGRSPITVYPDKPTEFLYAGGETYRPKNYGGGFSMHDVTMKTAMVRSLNVPTVEIAMETGLSRVGDYAEKFGFEKPELYPSLALGTKEVSPLALASAYTVFANGGKRVEPTFVSETIDANGSSVYMNSPQETRVVSEATAYMITDMLVDVVNRGTARSARGALGKNVFAGKTGTANDGWFVGYTPNLVCVVWVGFDDNKELGLTGAEAALPIWTEFMRGALDLYPELGGKTFPQPAGVTFVKVDTETGMLAGPDCTSIETVAVLRSTAPSFECNAHHVEEEIAEESTDEYADEENSSDDSYDYEPATKSDESSTPYYYQDANTKIEISKSRKE